jgi:surface antigen
MDRVRGRRRALSAVALVAGLGLGTLSGCTGVRPPVPPPPTSGPVPTSVVSRGGPPPGARTFTRNPYTGVYKGQCTEYAEERMHQATGKYMGFQGDAWAWGDLARSAGWTVGTAPALRSVAVFPRGAFGSAPGHVGWVEEIRGGQVRITDYNWNHRVGIVTDHWVTPPAGTVYIYSDR